mgnify:CR=1 FL=1
MAKKLMRQVSISLREDKFDFLKAWAEDRDESMATICRGWIYTGLADLQQALGRFELEDHPGEPEDMELMELLTEPEIKDDNERSVEQISVH